MDFTFDELKKMGEVDIHVWLKLWDIKTEDGKKLDFKDHLFLVQPYEDESKKIVVKKAAQIGFSTLAILKTLWMAKHKKLNIIYTLPSFKDVGDFVSGKVNRLINQNKVLQDYTADKDTIEQKHVGESVIYYRGTITEQAALMVSADLLVIDEYDRSKQSVVHQYSSRLQHSDYRGEWYFSNPSASGFGVDSKWDSSDKKHWMIKCAGCQKEQDLDWPDSIDLKRECYQCKYCFKELSNEERRVGRWESSIGVKDAEYSGYWMSLMMFIKVPAKEIIKYYREKPEDYFYNFVLGKEYTGAGNKLTWEAFAQNLKGRDRTPSENDRIVLGIDTGLKLDYVMGDDKGLFWHATAKDYTELDKHMERWPRAVAVIDAGGDLIGSRQFYERWQGRVYLCHLGGDRKTKEIVQWKEGEEHGNCIVDRYRIIQMVVDEFGKGKIPVWGVEQDWSDYWQDWNNLTRIKVKNPTTEEFMGYKWVRNGRDHKCFVAGTKILTNVGEKNIEDIRCGDKVLTRIGFKEVVWNTNYLEEVIDTGVLKGTADHPIWTENMGFKDLLAMCFWDKIIVCKPKQLFIKVLNFVDTLIQKIEQKEFTLSLVEARSLMGLGDSTSKSTKIILERSRRALLFITKIIIRLITRQTTWGLWIKENTLNYTWRNTTLSQKTKLKSSVILKRFYPRLIENWHNGVSRLKESKNFVIVLLKQLFSKILRSSTASNVVNYPQHDLKVAENTVVNNAGQNMPQENGLKPTHTIKETTTEKRTVYNFEVEDAHEYFANGILVSNCLATIFYRVGMDKFGFGGAEIINPDNVILAPVSDEISPEGTMRHLLPDGRDPVQATLEMLRERYGDD